MAALMSLEPWQRRVCLMVASFVVLTPLHLTAARGNYYGNWDTYEADTLLMSPWWGDTIGKVTQRYGCTQYTKEPPAAPQHVCPQESACSGHACWPVRRRASSSGRS